MILIQVEKWSGVHYSHRIPAPVVDDEVDADRNDTQAVPTLSARFDSSPGL